MGLGLFVFVIYFLTLYPSVPGGDSGELIAAAKVMGIAHPPGYPLFTILGKVFTWLPVGNVAWRVNLMSAVFDAGAAVLLFLSVVRWTASIPSALLAGGLFAFSPFVWSYAVRAEVFSMNNFFAAALLFCAVSYHQLKEKRYVYWGAALFGLGMGNHHTLLFFGIPMVAWSLWKSPKTFLSAREFLILSGLFLAGLLPYIYLPIAAAFKPIIYWGDFSTWDGFFAHVSRRDYGTFQLGTGKEGDHTQLIAGVKVYLESLPSQFLWIGPLLGIWGVSSTLKKEGRLGAASLTVFLFLLYVVVFHRLANLPPSVPHYYGVLTRFWQLPNTLMALWIGLGFSLVLKKLQGQIKYPQALPFVFVISILAVQVGMNYKEQDNHTNLIFDHYGRSILSPLPPKALFLTMGDLSTNTTRYLQQCEGYRSDVRIIDRQLLSAPWTQPIIAKNYPDIILPGTSYRFQKQVGADTYDLNDLISANGNQHSIFISNLNPREATTWDQSQSWPFGVVNRVVTPAFPFNLEEYLESTERAFEDLHLGSIPEFSPTSWEYSVSQELRDAEHRRGRRVLSYGIATKNLQAVSFAAKILQRLVDLLPVPPPALLKNLGTAYSIEAQKDSAQKMAQAWSRYLELVPEDSDAPTMRDAIRKVAGASK